MGCADEGINERYGQSATTVVDRTNDPLTNYNKTYKIFSTPNFNLYIKLKYEGNGIVSYEPAFDDKLGRGVQPYRVKEVSKKIKTSYLLSPETMPSSIANVYYRNDIRQGVSVTFAGDMREYGNKALAQLKAQAQSDFYRNGLKVVAGIYVGTGAAVAGVVMADIAATVGTATVLMNGVSTVVEIVKGASISAYAEAVSTASQLGQIMAGGTPIIRATLNSGRQILAAVLAP